ncbi:TolC family protein [Solitalea canadensis]|uniref:Outer membrane protein n=1 Tax=Solitalea canadensis (strain ATCC 29591 / DSM 3403 / JCM 21819 / LMG 8368 / NBRC 15130 / NCIMB 12057 / USAM 9D) TaxID=929556 RepID=H8KV64_SOLCM|nr:TolC family protein [Solitalea canadensis]AFD06122.1 outer membrane protein [Solitalea canadensis DSM 3403]
MNKINTAHIVAWIILILLGLATTLVEAQSLPNQSLTLKDVIELARSHNRDLKVDSLSISRSEQQTRIAKSQFLPTIGLAGQYQHYFQKPVFFGFDAISPDKINYGRVGGEDQIGAQAFLSQPIFNPNASPELKRSKLVEKQTQLQYRDREVDVVSDVKQVYLRILVLEKRLRLQNESVERNKKALEDSRSLLTQGKALLVDTLRAYTSMKNLEPDVLRLTYAIEVSKQQLGVLTGLDSLTSSNINLKDSLVYSPADVIPTEVELYKASLTQRADLQILALNRDVSQQQIDVAKGAKLPSLNLVSQYQLQSQANDFKFGSASWPPVFFVGAQVSIPLFTGFANTSRVKQAQIEQRQSHVIYTNAQAQLKTEVKSVLASLLETSKRIQTQLNVENTAETSYSITKYRYERGVASRLELVDAELALRTAQINYLEAVFEYQTAKIELDRTLGKVVY